MIANFVWEDHEPIFIATNSSQELYYLPDRKISFCVRDIFVKEGFPQKQEIDANFSDSFDSWSPIPFTIRNFPTALAERIHRAVLQKVRIYEVLSPAEGSGNESFDADFERRYKAFKTQQQQNAIEFAHVMKHLSLLDFLPENQYGTFLRTQNIGIVP